MPILIIASNDFLAMYALQCLRDTGMRVHVLGIGRFFPARFSRDCAGYFRTTLSEISRCDDALVAAVRDYCANHGIDTAVPSGMEATAFLSRAASRIALRAPFPVADMPTLRLLNDKWTFAQLMRRLNLPHPKTELLADLAQLDASALTYPIILKPRALHSGIGVRACASPAQVRDYVNGIGADAALPLIAQELLVSADMGMSVLAKDGEVLATTVQQELPDGSLVIHDDTTATRLGRAVAKETRFTGIANFDLLRDERDGKIVLIECNPRLWGSVYASKAAGVNFLQLGIRVAQGKPIDPQPPIRETRYIATKKRLRGIFTKNAFRDDGRRPFASDAGEMSRDPLPYALLFFAQVGRALLRMAGTRVPRTNVMPDEAP